MAERKPKNDPQVSATAKGQAPEKRAYFKQADFPQTSLQQAQKIASALVDNYAGKEASPPDIALALGMSPTSDAWPALAGSSIAYGLTEGGVNARVIKLLPLGKQLSPQRKRGKTSLLVVPPS
jgi:hypothetical protein